MLDNDQVLLTGMIMILAGGIWGWLRAANLVTGMLHLLASAGVLGIGIVVCYIGLRF